MNWLVYHVASGGAFFSGLALVVVAVILGFVPTRWLKRAGSMVGVMGVIAIAISGTPLALWYYAIAGCFVLFWLACLRSNGRMRTHLRMAAVLVVAMCVVSAVIELPYHLSPVLPTTDTNTIVVFGDSVTAGIGDHDFDTWPQLLSRSKSISVLDYSQMGATVSDALKTAHQISIPDGIVLLEIGGNDLLGSTDVESFARNLDALLARVSGERRHVVMFELPLPPFCNSFGRVQRSLARKYDVTLVPKRFLMEVFVSHNATLDSLHLSRRGHQAMADCVWRIIGPAVAEHGDRQGGG